MDLLEQRFALGLVGAPRELVDPLKYSPHLLAGRFRKEGVVEPETVGVPSLPVSFRFRSSSVVPRRPGGHEGHPVRRPKLRRQLVVDRRRGSCVRRAARQIDAELPGLANGEDIAGASRNVRPQAPELLLLRSRQGHENGGATQADRGGGRQALRPLAEQPFGVGDLGERRREDGQATGLLLGHGNAMGGTGGATRDSVKDSPILEARDPPRRRLASPPALRKREASGQEEERHDGRG